MTPFWRITLLITMEMLVSMIMFSAALALLVFLIRGHLKKYKPLDLAIFNKLQFLVSPANNKFMLFITFLGKHQFLIPANLLLIVYFLFVENQTWFSIRVIAIGLSSLVLMLLLKSLFKRKRPLAPLLQAARGLSFPSGHAIMAVTFYGLVIYIITQSLNPGWLRSIVFCLLLALIFLIGFSRVYLRVHYASDVLAGFIIGLLWMFISLAVLQKIETAVRPVDNDELMEVKASQVNDETCISQKHLTYMTLMTNNYFKEGSLKVSPWRTSPV